MDGQKDGGKKGEREEQKGSGREEIHQWEILESPAKQDLSKEHRRHHRSLWKIRLQSRQLRESFSLSKDKGEGLFHPSKNRQVNT